MQKFRIDLEGENFLFNQDGEPGKFGFSACCLVEARDKEEAGRIAAIQVRQNPLIREALADMEMIRPTIRQVEVTLLGPIRSLWKRPAVTIEFHPED